MAKLINGIDFNLIENDAIIHEKTSLQSFGYGIISRYVTTNKNLSLSAKGVYSYLIAFAGNDKQAYPSQSRMCYDLGIKKTDTLRKYIKELQAEGLIKIYRSKKNNIHYKNIYVIADDTRTVEVWKTEYIEDNGIKNVDVDETKSKNMEKLKVDENNNLVFEVIDNSQNKKSPTAGTDEDLNQNTLKNLSTKIISDFIPNFNMSNDSNSINYTDIFDKYVTNEERWFVVSEDESIWNELSSQRKQYLLDFALENKFYIPSFIK